MKPEQNFPDGSGRPMSAWTLLGDFARISGWRGVGTLFLVAAAAVLEGVGVSLLVPLLDVVIGQGAAPRWLQVPAAMLFQVMGAVSPLSRLLLLLGVFGVLIILRAFLVAGRDVATAGLHLRFIEILRLRIIRGLANARWDYIARMRHARIAHVMSGDVQRLSAGLGVAIGGAVAAVMVVIQCVLAYLLAPVAAVIMTLLLCAGFLALRPLLARSHSMGSYVADTNLALLDSTGQFLGGLKLAISQNLEGNFVGETERKLAELTERQRRYTARFVRNSAVVTALSALAGLVFVLAGFGWLHVPAPILITLLLLVTRMMAPVGRIFQGAQQFALALAVYEKIENLKGELASVARGTYASAPPPYPEGDIVFENVSYRHDGSSAGHGGGGLCNFDQTIRPGEFLGVTGASGTGKTTFADLLAGLLAPQEGRVTAGGENLGGALLTSWRAALSYVSQDPFLFHDTIRANLAWANSSASEEDMWSALSMAGADALVRRLGNGIDTIVGERGALVSGGERQRLALARALLRQPRLLILDEATSAIDTRGEREVLERLASMPITIVLIAHRLENLSVCDRLLVFGETEGGSAAR